MTFIPLLEVGARTNGGLTSGDRIGAAGDPMYTLQAGKQHGIAFAQNQREEVRDLDDLAVALNAEPGTHQQTYVAQSFRMQAFGQYAGDATASALKQRDHKDATDLDVTHALTSAGHDASEDGTGRGTPLVAYALGSHAGSNGAATNASHAAGGPVGMGIHEDVTPALRSARTQAVAAHMQVRRLTPKECVRLMGLPDDWLDLDPPLSDSAKYRLVGNSVAVPVFTWVFGRIARYAEIAGGAD